MIFVSQLFSTFDVRLREICSARIECEFENETFFYTLFKKCRINETIVFKKIKTLSVSYEAASRFFDKYDTYRIISTSEQKNQMMTDDDIKKLIDEVRKEIEKRKIKKSKDFVRYYLRERGVVFTQIIDKVYYSL